LFYFLPGRAVSISADNPAGFVGRLGNLRGSCANGGCGANLVVRGPNCNKNKKKNITPAYVGAVMVVGGKEKKETKTGLSGPISKIESRGLGCREPGGAPARRQKPVTPRGRATRRVGGGIKARGLTVFFKKRYSVAERIATFLRVGAQSAQMKVTRGAVRSSHVPYNECGEGVRSRNNSLFPIC